MFTIVMGGIYTGIFTPTEAAAIAVGYSVIIGLFVMRTLKWSDLPDIMMRAGLTSAVVLGALALTVERVPITVTPTAVFAMVWAVVLLSFGSTLTLLWLLQRGEASRVSALVFLTPPLSAIEAFLLFDDPIGFAAVAALGVTAVGVWLVLRSPEPVPA